jgi:hypothetical protein
MVALASPALVRHDLEAMHALVIGQLHEARFHKPTRILAESLAEECRAFIRHLLHAGVPEQIDTLADAACDLFEHATAGSLSGAARAEAREAIQRACRRMRAQQGREPAPITHILAIGKLAATMPRLRSCTPAHLETLAAPITRLLLHLFG